jgi:hypothetical protein
MRKNKTFKVIPAFLLAALLADPAAAMTDGKTASQPGDNRDSGGQDT